MATDRRADGIWPLVHAERRALAADLTGLAPEAWQTPSLCSGWTVHDVLAHMVATAKLTPPGPTLSWLGEALVHAEDIRRPLGLRREYPLAAVTAVTGFYAGSNVLIGGKRRVAGLTLKATDTDWSHGSGPVVEGPAVALMPATTGRKAALEHLSGPGAETLHAR
jgi:hypothetical protein